VRVSGFGDSPSTTCKLEHSKSDERGTYIPSESILNSKDESFILGLAVCLEDLTTLRVAKCREAIDLDPTWVPIRPTSG
jgi:hypothetical protein